MAADYGRIHRLLKILTLIQGSGGWTPRRLAQECGTTQRTIYRDLKMLEGAGIPYFYDAENKTYAVHRDFFMPSVQLTLDESLALAALAEQIGRKQQVPFTEPAARAIAKIRGQLPWSIRQELERIESNLAIHLAAANPPEAAADVYAKVRVALARRQALRCRYESVNGGKNGGDDAGDDREGKERGGKARGGPRGDDAFLFEPYALFFEQRAWYTVGRHDGRGEVRCLKLVRFTHIEQTDIAYTIPRSFSLSSHLGNAWRMIRGKQRYNVELHFDPAFAETIADTHWHRTQEIIWETDDSIRFRCTVDGLEEIVWWVLSMGPHCRVIKPTALAERVRELSRQMVDLYADPAAPPAPGAPARSAGARSAERPSSKAPSAKAPSGQSRRESAL